MYKGWNIRPIITVANSGFLPHYKLPTTNRYFNVLILYSEYDFNNEKNSVEDFKFINRPYSAKSENSDGASRRSSRRSVNDDDDEVHYTSGVSKKKNKFETVFDRVSYSIGSFWIDNGQ